MADKKNPETQADQPKVVGGPVPVPVDVDHAVAYGRGHEVHWERETGDGEDDS